MGELIGLEAFAAAKLRRLMADSRAESMREERAEALLDEVHRFRRSTQRVQRRRAAVALLADRWDGRDGPSV